MAHSSILAWGIPMDRGAWWATVHGSQRVGHDRATNTFTFTMFYVTILIDTCK